MVRRGGGGGGTGRPRKASGGSGHSRVVSAELPEALQRRKWLFGAKTTPLKATFVVLCECL